MSGGHFSYAFTRVDRFVDDLRNDLENPEECEGLTEQNIATLQRIAAEASHIARLMKEAEWLFSGDTGPETFERRTAEIEQERAVATGNLTAPSSTETPR